MFKQKNGITLIALVITIVLLLVLAGVVINLSMGENGLIGKAQVSVDKYKQAAQNEQIELGKYESKIEGNRDIGIIESGANEDNSAFYIKYSNGLIYQWGTFKCTSNISKNNGINDTINFIKSFTNKNYSIQFTKNSENATGSVASVDIRINLKNVSNVEFRAYNNTTSDASVGAIDWIAIGY